MATTTTAFRSRLTDAEKRAVFSEACAVFNRSFVREPHKMRAWDLVSVRVQNADDLAIADALRARGFGPVIASADRRDVLCPLDCAITILIECGAFEAAADEQDRRLVTANGSGFKVNVTAIENVLWQARKPRPADAESFADEIAAHIQKDDLKACFCAGVDAVRRLEIDRWPWSISALLTIGAHVDSYSFGELLAFCFFVRSLDPERYPQIVESVREDAIAAYDDFVTIPAKMEAEPADADAITRRCAQACEQLEYDAQIFFDFWSNNRKEIWSRKNEL